MKVLMIGNSFSLCVGKNLPQIVKMSKKHHLLLTSAYIGGCSLETHAAHLKQSEKDPEHKPYLVNIWNSEDLRRKTSYQGNVYELLKNNTYDVITIQQGSAYSWDYATYQPHADTVIGYIRKFNPQAKIMIQQTWAYRSDDPRLLPGENSWGFDRNEMHERVRSAYHKFAADTGFELIPTGDAISLYRTKLPQYKVLSGEELAVYKNPDLPPMANDIVGKFWWVKHNGEMKLMRDCIHLNFRGEYLQACVWYIALFGESTASIHYEHPKISSEECQSMAAAAGELFKPGILPDISGSPAAR